MKIVKGWIVLLTVAIILLPFALSLSQVFALPLCPTTITSSTTLSGPCVSTGNGILLDASGITLNCAGPSNTITYVGSTPNTYYGIYVGSGFVGDTVKNCQLTGGFEYGFDVFATSGLTLTGNSVTGAAYDGYYIYYVSNVVLTGNTATDNQRGFDIGSAYNIQLTRNVANGNTEHGFLVGYSVGGSLTNNLATSNEYDGFHLDSSSQFMLINNMSDKNVRFGFYDASNGPGTMGLGNTYVNNECHGNTGYGSYAYIGGVVIAPALLCTPQG